MKYKKNLDLTLFGVCLLLIAGFIFSFKLTSQAVLKINSHQDTNSVLNASITSNLLSISDLFDGVIGVDESRSISILVTGDLMPGRYVNIQSKKANDDLWAYRNIKSELQNKFVFANLESPIIKNCPDKSDGMIFCAPEYSAKALSDVGIDIVSLANNHTLNYGENGLNETISFLEKYGINYTGVNNPTIIELKGLKIAFLGFDDVECNSKFIECAENQNIQDDITLSNEKADVTIVMFHWGSEYRHNPTSRQVELAKFAVDSGADLVLGNHPHWYQTYEIYNNKIIAYSHGNFIFDQMWSTKTREGIISEYFFFEDSFQDVTINPILISNYGQPVLFDSANTKRIIDHIRSLSLTE